MQNNTQNNTTLDVCIKEHICQVKLAIAEKQRLLKTTQNRPTEGMSQYYIDKNANQIASLKSGISELQSRLDLKSDSVMEEIDALFEKRQAKEQAERRASIKKWQEKKAREAQEKKLLKERFKIDRDTGREERHEKQVVARVKTRLASIDASLPKHLRKKLKEMPNNTGFIFKGVSFFGERPEEEGPVLLSERLHKQKIMVFHEYKNVLKNGELWEVYTRSEKEILKKGDTRKAEQRVVKVEETKPRFPEFAKVTKMPKRKGKKNKKGKKDKKGKRKPEKKLKKQPVKQNAFCVLDDSSEDEDEEETELIDFAPVQGAWAVISEKVRTPTPIPSVTPTSIKARSATPGIRTKVNTFVAGLEADIDEAEEFIEMLYERLYETEDPDLREDIGEQIRDYEKTLEILHRLNSSTNSDSEEEFDDY